ncbi:GNAT family N-acetyltransferase [Flavobacterium amniphilum]|uniref:GNAT family N-acetyltransferase n=1 Tax=Flavobacterium amniphilum TaxID=1834035 RepID=UPI00202A72C8|nr:GNAT family N-acetyltransferase [Flavobacterium amniphilum]MCL9804758.1 GNAT family N-acetyltransferase [Flavobacterium amniphilum]
MIEIKIIASELTYKVRQPILRPGKLIESCRFEGDDLNTTIHFGLYKNDELIGVVSVFEVQNENFGNKKQYQVRGMAILENEQQNGYGNLLMTEVEKLALHNNVNIIWFNAREKAVSFYKKSGYETFGTEFDIIGIGTHFVMWKQI